MIGLASDKNNNKTTFWKADANAANRKLCEHTHLQVSFPHILTFAKY